jgi:rhodanese-related sulfurtransferase
MRGPEITGLSRMDRLLDYINHHPILVTLAVAMALAVVAFELRSRRMSYASVAPQEAIQLMNQGAHVVDLRTSEAFAGERINGAKHLEPEQHARAADSLKKFREKLLVLYCEDGSRASNLTRQLHAAGFTKVFNLRGGLATWRAEGLPVQRG